VSIDPFDIPEKIEVPESEFVKPTQVAADTKKTLIRLDDIALTEDGKVTKTKLFSFLKIGIEDYGDLAFDAEEAQIISRHLRFMSTGLNAVVPIYCGGQDKCPFAASCPFVKIKKIPLARICVAGDTRLQLTDGKVKLIKDIVPADRIYSCDIGSHQLQEDQAVTVINNGVRQVYAVTTAHGHVVTCTEDHLFWVIVDKVHRRSKPKFPGHSKDIFSLPHQWLAIEDGLKPGDKIAVASALPCFGTQRIHDALPTLLGYFLADGHSTKHQAWFYNTNKLYVDEFCECCRLFGVEPQVSYSPAHQQGGMNKKPSWSVVISHGRGEPNPFEDLLKEISLWDTNGPNKHVPNFLFTAPREQIRLFLNRLWSADGCVSVITRKGRNTKGVDIVIEQESELFIKQLQDLFLRFGVHGSLTKRTRKHGGFTYKFRVCGRRSKINFLEQIGPIFGKEAVCYEALSVVYALNDRYDHQEGDILWDYIRNITPVGEVEVFDIQVKNNNNFFANGILVHNCPIEASLMKTWTEGYLNEFGVDPNNLSELSLVQELAELDIYDRRATFLLSQVDMTQENTQLGQLLMQDQPVGVDTEGNAIYQTQIHQAWELKERLKTRKLRILEALVGTRKEKYKRDAAMKQKTTSDPSSEMAEIRKKLEKMREES